MWATVLWLFGCLASLDGPLVTNSPFLISYMVSHSYYASYLQSMLKLVPWFVVTSHLCHAHSLAATNRVTEQLSWLTVESFYLSCSISWMTLIDKWLRLQTKKGLQGGKTIQQRSELALLWSLIPNASIDCF
jgi:hypothetical protein